MSDAAFASSTIPVDAAFLKRKRDKRSVVSDDDEPDTAFTGANALIMPAGKKNKNKRPAAVLPEAPLTRLERRLSKSKARKLANVEIKREKKEMRNYVIASLKRHQLSLEQAALMKRSGSIGQKVTKKQTAKREAMLKQLSGDVDSINKHECEKSSDSLSEDWSGTESDGEIASVRKPFIAIQRPAPQPFSVPTTVHKEIPLPPPAHVLKPPLKLEKAKIPPRVAKVPYVVPVTRSVQLQEQRMQLPVCQMEQEVMETISEHDVVILCGETGSGKTTQVPQFLYEAGYGSCGNRKGMIAVTQPRRVAAIAMACRVAAELGTTVGKRGAVAHQIRYDSKGVTKETKVKFMTDGILLREIQEDLLLRKYSVIIVDEAHERNVNTDILIGLLSRAVPLRNSMATRGECDPIKLVIMSATLRVEDFTGNKLLFPIPPPVINVEARQYPVTAHFSKRTELGNYVGEALKKVSAIHRKLPDGGILVFVTGQDEVLDLCRRLTKRFSGVKRSKSTVCAPASVVSDSDTGDSTDADEDVATKAAADDARTLLDSVADADVADDGDDSDVDVKEVVTDRVLAGEMISKGGVVLPAKQPSAKQEATIAKLVSQLESSDVTPVHVLPLYSLLSKSEQMRVFQPPPAGHRLIVVATNVAETSLTIPNVRYVVDTGRAKQREYNVRSGTSAFVIDWISKASAQQRLGRAGRTGPGHCYRLYSSAVFERFPLFDEPEVLRMPIDGIVLQLKSMGIANVTQFPFPTPPPVSSLRAAVDSLIHLSALSRTVATTTTSAGWDQPSTASAAVIETERLTPLGQQLATLPILPRLGAMLLLSQEYGVTHYVAAVVAAMTVQSPFIRPSHKAATASVKDKSADTTAVEEEASDTEVSDYADEDSEGSDADGTAEKEREEMRKKFAAARAAHAKWAHDSSDALTLLNCVIDYVEALKTGQGSVKENGWRFCKANFLRYKTMTEILQLMQQLTRMFPGASGRSDASLLSATSSGDAVEVDALLQRRDHRQLPTLPPLSLVDEQRVMLCVIRGLVDHIARKASLDADDSLDSGKRWSKATRFHVPYTACTMNTPGVLNIHPMSSVYAVDGSKLPEYIAYHEIVTSKRQFMRVVTAVDPACLLSLTQGAPLCHVGEPLTTPLPYYDPTADYVMCYVSPTYGDNAWQLPAQAVRMPSLEDRCRVFARALLEGVVLPGMAKLKYASSPSMLTHRVPQRRCAVLIGALSNASPPVDCKAKLVERLRGDRHYLRDAVMMWAIKGGESDLMRVWDACVGKALV